MTALRTFYPTQTPANEDLRKKIGLTKGGAMPRIGHNVVRTPMKLKRPFKILALILAFLLVGSMIPHAFADCDSPCCGSKACHPGSVPTIPETCHLVDIFVKEIKSAPCNMNKVSTVEGTLGACLTVSRTERPAPGVYAVLFYELRPLSNPFEGPVRRPLNLARAAPEPLYLQNLTLLI